MKTDPLIHAWHLPMTSGIHSLSLTFVPPWPLVSPPRATRRTSGAQLQPLPLASHTSPLPKCVHRRKPMRAQGRAAAKSPPTFFPFLEPSSSTMKAAMAWWALVGAAGPTGPVGSTQIHTLPSRILIIQGAVVALARWLSHLPPLPRRRHPLPSSRHCGQSGARRPQHACTFESVPSSRRI